MFINSVSQASSVPELILNTKIPSISSGNNQEVSVTLPNSVVLTSETQLAWVIQRIDYTGDTKERVEILTPSADPFKFEFNSIFGFETDSLGRTSKYKFNIRLAGSYKILLAAVDDSQTLKNRNTNLVFDSYGFYHNRSQVLAQKTISLTFIPNGQGMQEVYPLLDDSNSPKVNVEISDPGQDSFVFVRLSITPGSMDYGNSNYEVVLYANDKVSSDESSKSDNKWTFKIPIAEYLRNGMHFEFSYLQNIPQMAEWSTASYFSRTITIPLSLNVKKSDNNPSFVWKVYDGNNNPISDTPVNMPIPIGFNGAAPYVDLTFDFDDSQFPAKADCLITATRVEANAGNKWVVVSEPIFVKDSCSNQDIWDHSDLSSAAYVHNIQLTFGTYSKKAQYRIVQGYTYGLDKVNGLLASNSKYPNVEYKKVIGTFLLTGPVQLTPSAKNKPTPSSSSASSAATKSSSKPKIVTVPNFIGLTVKWLQSHRNAYPGIHFMITGSSCSISDVLSGAAIIVFQNPAANSARPNSAQVILKTNC